MTSFSVAEPLEVNIPDVPPMESLKECASLLADIRESGNPLPILEHVIFEALADEGRVTVIEAELAANELIDYVNDQEFAICKRYGDSEHTEEGLRRALHQLKRLRDLRGLAILLLPKPSATVC